MKVLAETYSDRSLVLRLSALGGSTQRLDIRENFATNKLATNDGVLGVADDGIRSLEIRFPDGAGYLDKTVTLSW
jgi:hypothetical protein